MNALRYWLALSLGLLVVLNVAAAAGADDSLATARDLYAAAAYEDALAVLDHLPHPAGLSDEGRGIAQYRAFCLLALGRGAEAGHAIEAIVAAEPSYRPPDADMSPRVRTAFSDVRRRMLPGIVQQKYGLAKAAFDRREFAAAGAGFRDVMTMLDDPDVRVASTLPPLSDLRTLAAGFGELSATAEAPPPSPLPSSSPPPPAPEPLPAARPLEPSIYSAESASVVPPTIVRQTVPPFRLNMTAAGPGTLSVLIDQTGAVESATMLVPIDPFYDRLIHDAAMTWRYRPATLDGLPVKFRKNLQINVVRPVR